MSNLVLPGEPGPITVRADRWVSRLPSRAWPGSFLGNGFVHIHRNDLFALADRWRSGAESGTQFAAGVLAWGYGTIGYGPWRSGNILSSGGAEQRLEDALGGLRADAPTLDTVVDAYKRFAATSKLRRLGPAFFTKVLYFAGYRRDRGGVQPLILDRLVATQLPREAGEARRHRGGWSSTAWRDYLVWAAEQARRDEYQGEPERVEMALFTGRWKPPQN